MTEYQYLDNNKEELEVGDSVIATGYTEPPGVVVKIEEVDGDYDDELGRGVQIGPYVYVKWPESEELDRYTGWNDMTWANYPDGSPVFIFDDLEKVENE